MTKRRGRIGGPGPPPVPAPRLRPLLRWPATTLDDRDEPEVYQLRPHVAQRAPRYVRELAELDGHHQVLGDVYLQRLATGHRGYSIVDHRGYQVPRLVAVYYVVDLQVGDVPITLVAGEVVPLAVEVGL